MKRRTSIAILILLFCSPAFAAFNATAVWEVRASGLDTNGGGFDPGVGSPGVDRSQSDSPFQSYTDIVIGGTTTQATSAAHAFTANDVGNFVNIASGSGCTVQIATIISQSGGTATFDKSLGTAASTCTGKLGGGLASVGKITTGCGGSTCQVAGNTIYLQGSIASVSAAVTMAVNGTSAAPIRIIGYSSTRTDGVQATLTANANGMSRVFYINATNIRLYNVLIDCASKTTCSGITVSGNNAELHNVTVQNFTVSGVLALNGMLMMDGFHATAGVSGCTSGFSSQTRVSLWRGWINANPCHGIQITSGGGLILRNSVIEGNTGSTVDGININVAGSGSTPVVIEYNSIYGNGRDGIHVNSGIATGFDGYIIRFNVITGHTNGSGAWGINQAGSTTYPTWAYPEIDYNFYFSNTSGNITGFPAGANDVTLTADPFSAAGSHDFRLNNTAGGGASVKQTLTTIAGQSSYIDSGALGSQVTAGGGQKASPFLQ